MIPIPKRWHIPPNCVTGLSPHKDSCGVGLRTYTFSQSKCFFRSRRCRYAFLLLSPLHSPSLSIHRRSVSRSTFIPCSFSRCSAANVGPNRSPGPPLWCFPTNPNTFRRNLSGLARLERRPAFPCTSPAAPCPDSAATAASPAGNSPSVVPPLSPASVPRPPPGSSLRAAAILPRSSLSFPTRPPQRGLSLTRLRLRPTRHVAAPSSPQRRKGPKGGAEKS
jgi:hypothetical protein